MCLARRCPVFGTSTAKDVRRGAPLCRFSGPRAHRYRPSLSMSRPQRKFCCQWTARWHAGRMGEGFSGEVATYYARDRRGDPPAAVDAIAEAFALTTDDLAVDLGCGSGQLSLPPATRV